MITARPRLGQYRRLVRECRVPATVYYKNQLWRTALHEAGHVVGGLDGGMIPIYASIGRNGEGATGGVLFRPMAASNVPGEIAYMVMFLTAFYAENLGPFQYARSHHEGMWDSDADALNETFDRLPHRVRNRAYLLAHLRAAGLVSRRRLDILRIAKQLMHKRVWRP